MPIDSQLQETRSLPASIFSAAPRAVVLNSSHTELDELAGELALRGRVHHYFGRYFPRGRMWERLLDDLPLTRDLFRRGPGRRVLPRGLDHTTVTQAGTLLDFAAGFVPRQSRGMRSIYDATLRQRDRAIIRAARRSWDGHHPIIANHSIALEMFRLAQAAGHTRILNFPIAHPEFFSKLMREEAELHPEFSLDLLSYTRASWNDLLKEEIELATCILVGSSFVKRSFVEQGVPAEKVFSSPYGVDVGAFASPAGRVPDKTFRAVWVGQMTQRKGIKYLFEAWKSFAGPNTELVVAGNHTLAAAACSAYSSLFRYVGFLTVAGLKQLYQTADVLVLPSLIEGMPLVVLQAMAAQVPVIVTDHGPGDIVRDGIDGFLVPIRDSAAIVDRLTYLKDHPEVRAEMGRNAGQRALQFTWERFRQQAADHIEQIL